MNIKLITTLSLLIITTMNSLNGQSYEEIQKLKEEYNQVLERKALQKSEDISDAEKTINSTALPDKLIYSRKDVESLLANTEKMLKHLKFLEDSLDVMPHIGYEIFTKRDSVPYWQNLPLPKYYNLGPGDEVIISLWGETQSNTTNIINRDGQIYIDDVGILNLGGKTIEEAKEYIISKYSNVYSTLLGKTPKSFIDITLGELKSVNVHFVGNVNLPGVHMIHPFSNIVNGLTQAGGVTNNGSLRDIHLIRNGDKIASFDIYNYLFLGKSVSDQRLLDQDIIFIPPRISTVTLTGNVRKQGYYEIINDETVKYLIDISGGFDSKSSKTILMFKNAISTESKSILLKVDDLINFTLSDGDSLFVPTLPNLIHFVRIEGQIKNSGIYPYQKNMDLIDLIEATNSTFDKDFMRTVDSSNIIISRKNSNGSKPLTISIDLRNQNPLLNNGDHITISRNYNFQPLEVVRLTGEVHSPGIYPVNNMTSLSQIIDLSGGYTSNALINGVEIFRDSSRIGWNNDTFLLTNGDSLNFLKKTGLVKIDGEVNVPGYLDFKKGDSIKKYINRAGGFNAFADTREIYIIYPNGIAKPKTRLSSPKVLEGSTIIVEQRNISGSSKGPTFWENFGLIFSQAGSIATTLLTLMLLTNGTNSSG